MISAIHWVPRGANREIPLKYELNEAEYEKIKKITGEQIEAAKLDLKEHLQDNSVEDKKTITSANDDPSLSKYNLDDYDNEEGGENILFGPTKEAIEEEDNQPDPYLNDDFGDDDSDIEDTRILPTDSLLLAAKTDNEISQLEVYNYEEDDSNMYMHHDSLLPSMPICLEWLNFKPESKPEQPEKGSFVAIGTFEPEIEIWDLDYIDCVYPAAILGSRQQKTKSKSVNSDYHVDAVLALSWNKSACNLIASASADTTIKLWDLSLLKCLRSYDVHSDKVQCLQWHPFESTILLSGGFDQKATVFDSRSPQTASSWVLGSDVECMKWDPLQANVFYASTENGLVQAFDVRNFSTNGALFTIHAHDQAVSTFDVSPIIPGCLVTGSADKTIKIWNIQDFKPNMILSRNFDLGQVFTLSFNPDSPYKLAMAGSEGEAKVWDITSNTAVRSSFQSQGYKFVTPIPSEKQPICVVNDDGGYSDSDNEIH